MRGACAIRFFVTRLLVACAMIVAVHVVPAALLSGSALRFSGTNQYVSIPHNAAYNSFPITVSAWVRTTNLSASPAAVVSKYFSADYRGWSMHTVNGRLRAWYFRDNLDFVWNYNGDQYGIDGGFIADGRWHHVAMSVDATGGRLFVDGAFKQSLGWFGAAGAPNTTAPLHVAAIANFATFLRGEVDEVSIWNYALTNDAVNYIKYRQLSGTEDGLVSYWRFDEATGTTVTETTFAARTGTLIGGVERIGSTAPIALSPIAGSSLRFDGVDDQVSVAAAPDLNPFPITVAAWVRTARVVNNYEAVVNKYAAGSGIGWSLHLYGGRIYGFYFRDSANRVYVSDPGLDGGFIADGQFHHVALMVDASGGKLFVDGVQRNSLAWTGAAGAPVTNTPVLIGKYPSFGTFLGQIDEISIWNRTFSAAELQAMLNLPLAGSEPNLLACWRLNEGSGFTAADATGLGHTATLQNGTAWSGSLARLGDGSVRTITNLDLPDWVRRWEIQGSPQFDTFPLSAPATFRRFHDFGSAPAPVSVNATIAAILKNGAAAAVPLTAPAATNSAFTLVSENANAPASNSIVSVTPTLRIDPVAQLASVSDTFAPTLSLSHSEEGGAMTADESWTFPLGPLLDFNGQLFFNSLETRFTSIANQPTPGAASGGGTAVALNVDNNSGYLAARPTHHYGSGAPVAGVLFDDGRVQSSTASITFAGPVPDREVLNGITFDRTNVSYAPASGLRANVILRFPVGFGVSLDVSNRVVSNVWFFASQPVNAQLIPTAASLGIATPLYGIEETKPFWMQAPSLTWTLGAGTLTLNPPVTLRFVRQAEEAALASVRSFLADPTTPERPSNDSLYRNISSASGPVVISGDTNGFAVLSLDASLATTQFRPHFPYCRALSNEFIAVNGGRLLVTNDAIDTAASYASVGGAFPVLYARDCDDTNCAGIVLKGPQALAFTPDAGQLNFTADGGLVGSGAVPQQNLPWGFAATIAGVDRYAQTVLNVSTGAYHMPGTFLHGRAVSVDGESKLPAVLLLTGWGNATNSEYRERPTDPSYFDGLANYAGVNFRSPAQAFSYIAEQTTAAYPLTSRSKYYARWAGVNGIHEAQTFPGSLSLYGYNFTLLGYRLSYLDSENHESRSDGAVLLPYPSQFSQEFAELKFLCRGGIDRARVPSGTAPKFMAYWNTTVQPLSFEFKGVADDLCNQGPRYLVLGVETQLPLIPQKFHAALGFKPNGHLTTAALPLQGGVNSRFPVPAQVHLRGPGDSRYTITTAAEGYFNDYAASGAPPNGFYNLVGKLDLPFFEDSKVQLHVEPTGAAAGNVYVLGGWRAADKHESDLGWKVGDKTYFNDQAFDAGHRGFPIGLSAAQYRNPGDAQFHPRAQAHWLDLVKFDYALNWDPLLRRFTGVQAETTQLPVIDVSSKLKELTPGKVDIDFAQDINIGLPRLKVLDFANDALGEVNGAFNSVSNAIRDALGSAVDATGLTRGTRAMQRTLRDNAEGFFRPVLEPTLDPVVDRLYPILAEQLRTNAPNFLGTVSSAVVSAAVDLKGAVRGINGVAGDANSVLGKLNGTLSEVDDTLSLLLRMLEKDGSGNRHVVRIILQKVAADQGPAIGLAGAIGDTLANDLLREVEPTLAEIEKQVRDLRSQLGQARAQLAAATGAFSDSLATVLNTAGALDAFVAQAGSAVSNLMALAVTPAGDFFTADPATAKRQLRERLLQAFLASTLPAQYQKTFKQFLYDDDALLNQLMATLFQQVNNGIRDALADQLTSATDNTFKSFKGAGLLSGSLAAAKIRGAPEFNGDAMQRLRLDAAIKMRIPDDMDFTAFLEIKQVNSANTPLGCIPAGSPAAEITLGANQVPLGWAGIGAGYKMNIAARWNMQGGSVYGVGGKLELTGDTKFKSVSIDYFGATLAVGEFENYFAARAAGTAEAAGYGMSAQVGIFAGKTCRIEPLELADPEVRKVLPNPNDFSGIYVQFGGVFPLTQLLGIPASCVFRADGYVNNVFYYQGGPRLGVFGGRQKVGLDVDLLCILGGNASYSAMLQVSASELSLTGEAEICAEVGICPVCEDFCGSITVKGVVNDGGIDYFVDY